MNTGPQGERGEKGATGKTGSSHYGGLALVVLIFVSGFSILAFGIHKADKATAQAHKALCALYVGDLQRAQDTIDYLADHPNGAPSLGINAAALLQRVKALQQQAHDVNPGGCDVSDRLKELTVK